MLFVSLMVLICLALVKEAGLAVHLPSSAYESGGKVCSCEWDAGCEVRRAMMAVRLGGGSSLAQQGPQKNLNNISWVSQPHNWSRDQPRNTPLRTVHAGGQGRRRGGPLWPSKGPQKIWTTSPGLVNRITGHVTSAYKDEPLSHS